RRTTAPPPPSTPGPRGPPPPRGAGPRACATGHRPPPGKRPPTVKLLLIRHSEPDPGRDALDPPLTERGRQLATDTGRWLAGEEITVVYSSTTRRALETAALIAESADAPVIQREGLAEFADGHE